MGGAISKEIDPSPYHEYDYDEVAGEERETNSVWGGPQTTGPWMDGVYALG
jgi:hypothetical protein